MWSTLQDYLHNIRWLFFITTVFEIQMVINFQVWILRWGTFFILHPLMLILHFIWAMIYRCLSHFHSDALHQAVAGLSVGSEKICVKPCGTFQDWSHITKLKAWCEWDKMFSSQGLIPPPILAIRQILPVMRPWKCLEKDSEGPQASCPINTLFSFLTCDINRSVEPWNTKSESSARAVIHSTLKSDLPC